MSTFFVTLVPQLAGGGEGPHPKAVVAGASGAAPAAPLLARRPSLMVALRDLKADQDPAVWRTLLPGHDADAGPDVEVVRKPRNQRSKSMSVTSLPRPLPLNALRVGHRPSFPPPAFPDAGESDFHDASKEAHIDIEAGAIPQEKPDSAQTGLGEEASHSPRRTRLSSRASKSAKPLEDVLEGSNGVIG